MSEITNPGPEFDLLAWLGEAAPVTRDVVVYGRPDLVEEINRLEVEAAAAARRERSMGEKSPAAMRREVDALREKYEASALTVKVRARQLGDLDAINKAAKAGGVEPGDGEGWNLYASARWIVSPAMDVDTLRRFVEKIGVVQFEQQIVATWEELSTKVPVPTVPLSPRP